MLQAVGYSEMSGQGLSSWLEQDLERQIRMRLAEQAALSGVFKVFVYFVFLEVFGIKILASPKLGGISTAKMKK